MQPIWAETKRVLDTALAFVQNSVLTVRLPLDTAMKGILIRMSGTVTYTFSSAPVAKETSIMDNIVTRIEVVAGGRTIKNTRPHMIQMLSGYARGFFPERRASAAAAAAYQNMPLADAGMVYGSTTQVTTVLECLYLPFECIVAQDDDQPTTWLDSRGLPSCDLRIITGAIAGPGGLDKTTNATFTANAITFEVTTVEAPGFVVAKKYDYKQTVDIQSHSAAVTDFKRDLPRQGKCLGIGILVIQDSTLAAGDATSYKPNNNSMDTVKLSRNGREIISTTFRSLFSDNQSRGGMNAPFSSSVSRRDGYVYMDLLQNRKLGTALDVTKDNSFELRYTLRAAHASNVYPIEVGIETSELVEL